MAESSWYNTKIFVCNRFGLLCFNLSNVTASVSSFSQILNIFILDWDSTGILGSLQQSLKWVRKSLMNMKTKHCKGEENNAREKKLKMAFPFFLNPADCEKLLTHSHWWQNRLMWVKILKNNSKCSCLYPFVVF